MKRERVKYWDRKDWVCLCYNFRIVEYWEEYSDNLIEKGSIKSIRQD